MYLIMERSSKGAKEAFHHLIFDAHQPEEAMVLFATVVHQTLAFNLHSRVFNGFTRVGRVTQRASLRNTETRQHGQGHT